MLNSMACNEGIITKFIDYGAQINAAGDHSEVVQGAGAMGANERLITTGLYTYTGARKNILAKLFAIMPIMQRTPLYDSYTIRP